MERRKVLRKFACLDAKRKTVEKDAALEPLLVRSGPASSDVGVEDVELLLSPQNLEYVFEELIPYEEAVYFHEIGFETPVKGSPMNKNDLTNRLAPTSPKYSPDESFDSSEFFQQSAKRSSQRTIEMYRQKGVNPTMYQKKLPFVSQHDFHKSDNEEFITPMSVAYFSDADGLDGETFGAVGVASSNTSSAVQNNFVTDFNPFSTDEVIPYFHEELLRRELLSTPCTEPSLYIAGTEMNIASVPYSGEKQSLIQRVNDPRLSSSEHNKENRAPNPRKNILPPVSGFVNQDSTILPMEYFIHPFAQEPTYVPVEWLDLYASRPKFLAKEQAVQDWLQQVLDVALAGPKRGHNH